MADFSGPSAPGNHCRALRPREQPSLLPNEQSQNGNAQNCTGTRCEADFGTNGSGGAPKPRANATVPPLKVLTVLYALCIYMRYASNTRHASNTRRANTMDR